ncbi:hypothetical protein Q5O14_08940 [Eubacteriaceae bacterium ES2]|nr:hypothetical protein Q5O14_08940 [Eubacteriaceae bacterium ES2]
MKLEVVENHLDNDEATYHCAFIGSGSTDVDSTEGEETWSYHTKGDGTELKFHHHDLASGKLAALIFDKAFKNTVNHALENLKDICESHTEI